MPAGPAPLAATYRLLTRLCPPLAVSITDENFIRPEDAGWHDVDIAGTGGPGRTTRTADATGVTGARRADGPVRAGDLVVDGSGALDALIDGESERVTAAYGRRPRRDVAASRFLHHYLWSVGLLFTGPWYLTGRVPRVPLDRITADPATGAFTLDVRGLECGPGAGRPDAVRDAVAEHVRPVLEAFGPRVRRGPRALWGMVTDDLASGLWFLGRARGEEDRGARAASALLPGGTAPFPGAAAFRVLRGPSGRPHTTRTRLGCCLYYAITPEEPCVTCPRLTDGERLRRLERA